MGLDEWVRGVDGVRTVQQGGRGIKDVWGYRTRVQVWMGSWKFGSQSVMMLYYSYKQYTTVSKNMQYV